MKNQKRWGLFFFISPVLLWLVLLIVLPQIDLLVMSFRLENDEGRMVWSLSNYLSFFEEPIYWLTFVRTAIYSILVTFLTFIIALPVAFYITKVVAPKFQGFLLVLLLLPFWVSELVRVYGWMILLRESGVINHFLTKVGILGQPVEMLYKDSTMILGLVYTSMLFMVVPIVVFMLTLGNYLTPNLMGGKNSLWFTEQIYNQFIASFNWNQGSAFGFLLLILSSIIVWLGLKLARQNLKKVVQ